MSVTCYRMKNLFLIFDDCKILNKDLHQLILDYEKKWNYSISSSHWVVYAKGNYFIAALPHDMQDPRGAFRAMGEQKMCDLTQVNIEDKMKQLAEEGTTKIGEKIGFQVLQDEENHLGEASGNNSRNSASLVGHSSFSAEKPGSIKKDAFISKRISRSSVFFSCKAAANFLFK
jgi:hypothetical protein